MKKVLRYSVLILGLGMTASQSVEARGKDCAAVYDNCKTVVAEKNCLQCNEVCKLAVKLCMAEAKDKETTEAEGLLEKCAKACSSDKSQ